MRRVGGKDFVWCVRVCVREDLAKKGNRCCKSGCAFSKPPLPSFMRCATGRLRKCQFQLFSCTCYSGISDQDWTLTSNLVLPLLFMPSFCPVRNKSVVAPMDITQGLSLWHFASLTRLREVLMGRQTFLIRQLLWHHRFESLESIHPQRTCAPCGDIFFPM